MNRYHMLVALLLVLIVPLPAEAVLVRLDVSDTEISVGENFTVSVLVDGEGIGEELLGFGFDVAAPGAVAAYLGHTVSALFDDFSDPIDPNNVTGLAFPGVADDEVLLAALSFSAIAAGTDTLSVLGLFDGLFFGLFYDTSGIDINASADITVRAAAVPEPGSVFLLSTGLFALLVLKRRERVLSLR